MSTRAQQSYTRPLVKAISEGDTTPNPGVTNALVFSSTTGTHMRWTGTAWTRVGPHTVAATVDFGFPTGGEDSIATVTVAATSVTTGSVIVCTPAAVSTADHDPQDPAAEGITAYAGNLVAGVGFDVTASAPAGTWGRYLIHAAVWS